MEIWTAASVTEMEIWWQILRQTSANGLIQILFFAYTPVDDAEVHKTAWADFMTHMEKVTDKKVKYFIIQSNAVQIQAMRAERLHVATFNTGSVPLAVNCAGFVPFSTVSK